MAISAARIVPEPSGLVRISASPSLAPALVSACWARPVTVKPSVSSAPWLVCPPTTSAPALAKTSAAAPITSAKVRACNVGDRRGRITCAKATCGVAPMAQISPMAWIAVNSPNKRGSQVKVRRWSVVITCTPWSVRKMAASSPAPVSTSRRCGRGKVCIMALSPCDPTLAPQPPHRGLSPKASASPKTAGSGGLGAGMAG